MKNDKVTFAVVIGILFCSLIYTSVYTLVVKEENEKFKHELKAIEQEMNVLFEVLPTPDAESTQRKRQILRQVALIRKNFYQNNVSPVSKQELIAQLGEVKNQVGALEERVKTVIEEEQQQAAAVGPPLEEEEPGTLVPLELPRPHAVKVSVHPLPVRHSGTSPQKKLSVYYFRTFSSDKKSRYHRTKHITLQLQLQGDMGLLPDPYLRVEIRDPNHRIITGEKDRIRAATEYMTSYDFVPEDAQPFKPGRYAVRIFSADGQFQQLTFLILT
ncbi:MAG: hypothetical protein ICV83_18405 [Cytophagales bacterium]|nr:hypothetical protein [Cytophagales bacterium]